MQTRIIGSTRCRRLAWMGALSLALVAIAAPLDTRAAHHEKVLMVVAVDVAPGKLDQYRGQVQKLQGVMQRLESDAQIRAWQVTAGGEDAGTVVVGVEYPNAEAWARDTQKAEGDAEWQQLMSGLADVRTVESVSLYREITPAQSGGAAGPVLSVTTVEVNAGKLEAYKQRIANGQSILERLGVKGRMRMWQATTAGPATGNVVVGIEYPDLATFVSDQAKVESDAEWQKLVAELPAIRTLQGNWLYEELEL